MTPTETRLVPVDGPSSDGHVLGDPTPDCPRCGENLGVAGHFVCDHCDWEEGEEMPAFVLKELATEADAFTSAEDVADLIAFQPATSVTGADWTYTPEFFGGAWRMRCNDAAGFVGFVGNAHRLPARSALPPREEAPEGAGEARGAAERLEERIQSRLVERYGPNGSDYEPDDQDCDIRLLIAALRAQQPADDTLREEVERLRAMLNTPEVEDFAKAVVLEAQHQRERWPSEHDAGKAPLDWFWLVGYLAQKAATAQMAGDDFKAKHHTISTAAALANWHAAITGEHTAMRPGIDRSETEALAALKAETRA